MHGQYEHRKSLRPSMYYSIRQRVTYDSGHGSSLSKIPLRSLAGRPYERLWHRNVSMGVSCMLLAAVPHPAPMQLAYRLTPRPRLPIESLHVTKVTSAIDAAAAQTAARSTQWLTVLVVDGGQISEPLAA